MLSAGKSSFWRNANPAGAVADFREVWRQSGKRRWPFVAAALATTLCVFSVIAGESWRGPPAKPTIVYINSWPADRSDEEIRRSNIENQKIKEALAAAQAKRDAKVKEIYRQLGRVSGMDVDKIERDAAIEATAEKAAHRRAIGLAPAETATKPDGQHSETSPVAQP